MIVLDASAWVMGLVDSGAAGDGVREVIGSTTEAVVPAHCRLEVVRTLGRLEHSGRLSAVAAGRFLDQVLATEVREVGAEAGLLRSCWELRHNVSPYDAPYLVIARGLDVPLVTCDQRLARAARSLEIDTRLVR